MINAAIVRKHLDLDSKTPIGEVSLERFKEMMKRQDKNFQVLGTSFLKIEGKEVSIAHYQGTAQLHVKGRHNIIGTQNYTTSGVIFAV